MKNRLSFLFLLLAAFFQATAAEAPDTAKSSEGKIDLYQLNVTDKISVRIYQEEELTTIVRIDAGGKVNLPLVKEVKISGLTVRDAQAAIENAYRENRYLRSPQVTLTVEEYAPREVSIQGQVRAPGRYTLPIESTFSVIELVTKAGGLTDVAKGSSVMITRIGLDGQKTTTTVDVESILKGKGKANSTDTNLLLKPGDIVYVPERII
ncbi:MAG TPA: polysaccharide biosynthesis/export family protein [Opitutaceae bacterium]|nr:polysaccharide biosynthesis/export family protein [Opitutaceae bacterium]